MKTRAVRLYGESDLRLEEFDMGELKDDEILMELITDSVCMSTYKESIQGAKHQRVNDDISEHPIIVGHEFAGIIREVGAKWKDKYQVGTKYTMQPAINIKGSMAAIGYSYEYCGGAATFIKVPPIVMEKDCLLPFDENSAFFEASLAEPMSCIIGAFHSMYHSERGVYEHKMGIVEGGKSALLASCGPMGLGAISYMLNCDRKPSLLVITDIDEVRLKRASELFTEEYAKERGVEIHFVNTAKVDDPVKTLRDLTGGTGFDDVFCYAPVEAVVELSSAVLGRDGCLNFFAGPTDKQFSARMNFYDVSVMNEVFRQKDGEEAAQATATFQKKERMGIKKRIKAFKKYHGLSSEDVLFFDTSKFLVEKAKQEDFIVMGRFAEESSVSLR